MTPPHLLGGGFEVATTELVVRTTDHVVDGVKWYVCSAAGRNAHRVHDYWSSKIQQDQVALRMLPAPLRLVSARARGLVPGLTKRLLFRDLDLLHLHSLSIVPAFPSERTVLTLYDVCSLAGFGDSNHFSVWLHDALMTVHTVITSSAFSKQEIVRLVGVPENRIVVIPLGVDHHLFHPYDNAGVSKVDSGQNYILISGGSGRRKNIDRAITAFAYAVKQLRSDLRLVVCGSAAQGEYGQHVRELARDLGIADRLDLRGHVDRAALPLLMARARALLFPSLYEGFGLPIVEAMACGTPVITSNLSSMPELAGDVALLVDPYEPESIAAAIVQIVRDDGLYAHLHEQGPRHAQQFTWDRSAQALLTVYGHVLGRRLFADEDKS